MKQKLFDCLLLLIDIGLIATARIRGEIASDTVYICVMLAFVVSMLIRKE